MYCKIIVLYNSLRILYINYYISNLTLKSANIYISEILMRRIINNAHSRRYFKNFLMQWVYVAEIRSANPT